MSLFVLFSLCCLFVCVYVVSPLTSSNSSVLFKQPISLCFFFLIWRFFFNPSISFQQPSLLLSCFLPFFSPLLTFSWSFSLRFFPCFTFFFFFQFQNSLLFYLLLRCLFPAFHPSSFSFLFFSLLDLLLASPYLPNLIASFLLCPSPFDSLLVPFPFHNFPSLTSLLPSFLSPSLAFHPVCSASFSCL